MGRKGKSINWTQDKINFIIDKYTNKEMNTYQLAKFFNCSNDTISRKLKANNIPVHKFYEDLSGQHFGKLTVIKKSEKSNRRLYWECQCDCGNVITIKGDLLRQHNRQLSCGCINSKTELFIANLLKQNNVKFIQQYTFNDLISEYNRKLRFDFGIIDDNNKLLYLIEYDGEQHFLEKVQNNGWNNIENFYKNQERDQQKNNFCLSHNIPLIRIPYYHLDLTLTDLLGNKFIFKGE